MNHYAWNLPWKPSLSQKFCPQSWGLRCIGEQLSKAADVVGGVRRTSLTGLRFWHMLAEGIWGVYQVSLILLLSLLAHELLWVWGQHYTRSGVLNSLAEMGLESDCRPIHTKGP